MTGAVETARLLGEPIASRHARELEPILGDARVGATLGGTLAPAQVAASVARQAAHWDRHGFGYWAWRERASGALVARGGLQHTTVGGREEIEVGWAVAAERWGEGFATELGGASVRLAFDELGLPDIVAFSLVDNRASRRVMEKLGFELERHVEHAGLPHVLYRLAQPSGA